VTRDVADFSDELQQQLSRVILALSAEARLKFQSAADFQDAARIVEGRKLIDSGDMRCTECHTYHFEDEDMSAPTLTGYGSREWLMGLIDNPAHALYYGEKNDRMPAFKEEQILSPLEIGLIADWLRGDWYEPGELAGSQ
jgi:ubiquinol-cytochrome c reductase cytochrome b subunit